MRVASKPRALASDLGASLMWPRHGPQTDTPRRTCRRIMESRLLLAVQSFGRQTTIYDACEINCDTINVDHTPYWRKIRGEEPICASLH